MTNKLVSIDVFDTAIFRTVFEPKDIFKLVEEKVGGDFYNKRIEAEAKAAQKFTYYNIGDIYSFLRPEFNPSEEIDMEFLNCVANQELLKMYNKNPKKYIFISDMYLPSYIIKEMLKKVGYKNPRVFVSCEMMATKANGKLFQKVQEQIGEIECHYGDNYVADIEGAKAAGIERVVFNPALHNRSLNLPMINNTFLKKYIALNYHRDPRDKIALYTVPLITEFTKWVLLQRQKGQKIFFLSRDMYMPYILAKEELKAPDVYYIHASRRSLAKACLQSSNEALINRVSDLFSQSELEDKKHNDIQDITLYLNKFNINDGDIIADIGYAGTIQAGINQTLQINTKGCYMQVGSDSIKGLDMSMFLNRSVITYCLLIEAVMGSDEDCIEGYKNGKVVFKPENKERKKLAKRMTSIALKAARLMIHLDIDLFDVEQILIHLQYYPTDDMINIFNKNIYSNRSVGESIIGFDKERILNGELRDCYNKSYAKPLFKKLLEADEGLRYLGRLLD